MPRVSIPRRAVRSAPILLGFALFATGCVDSRPSGGRCTGTIGGRTVDVALVPDVSDFHRWDGLLADEDGPFRMTYGAPDLTIDAEFESVPRASYVGAHPILTDPIFHFFRVALPTSTASFVDGDMTLTGASIDRVVGSMLLRLSDGGELRCTFDLRHNYALDDGI